MHLLLGTQSYTVNLLLGTLGTIQKMLRGVEELGRIDLLGFGCSCFPSGWYSLRLEMPVKQAKQSCVQQQLKDGVWKP